MCVYACMCVCWRNAQVGRCDGQCGAVRHGCSGSPAVAGTCPVGASWGRLGALVCISGPATAEGSALQPSNEQQARRGRTHMPCRCPPGPPHKQQPHCCRTYMQCTAESMHHLNHNQHASGCCRAAGGVIYLFMLSPSLCGVTLGISAILWMVTLIYGDFARRTQKVGVGRVGVRAQPCGQLGTGPCARLGDGAAGRACVRAGRRVNALSGAGRGWRCWRQWARAPRPHAWGISRGG